MYDVRTRYLPTRSRPQRRPACSSCSTTGSRSTSTVPSRRFAAGTSPPPPSSSSTRRRSSRNSSPASTLGAWSGAASLQSIYTYLLSELIETNMTANPERAVACRGIIAPLQEAWRTAADELSAPRSRRSTRRPSSRVSSAWMNAVSGVTRLGASPLHGPGDSWGSAWSEALAELELSVDQAEAQLAAIHRHEPAAAITAVGSAHPWEPRRGLGPLPASLRTRAQALLDRQLDTARRVTEVANLSRRQAQAAEGMRSRPPAVPVYLDAEG